MQRSLSMERSGIPLYFTMFGIRLLYPIIARIKYDVKDVKYLKLFKIFILKVVALQQNYLRRCNATIFKIFFKNNFKYFRSFTSYFILSIIGYNNIY